MLGTLRTSALCRLAAAALALALSGAPRAAAAFAPEKPHRCMCRHGAGERCTCPVCGKRARAAKRHAAVEAPPCHRAELERAVAADEERERREREVPCIQGDCGGEQPAAPPRASAEAFTLPDPPVIGRVAASGVAAAPASADGADPAAPEPPPPRCA